MITAHVELKGHKAVIQELGSLPRRLDSAAKRALRRIAMGIHREAYDYLSGPADPTGGYPVPVRTGHLRRMLDWVSPGATKSAGGETFTAGNLEAIVYDSAAYSEVIHGGLGSSKKYGKRPYLTDGFTAFNQGARIEKILNEEIAKEL